MAETSISWTHTRDRAGRPVPGYTFNPWIGCKRIAPACDFCFAAAEQDTRYHRVKWGGPGVGVGTRVRTAPANWNLPLRWNRKAANDNTRPFVFCASLADVFDNAVDPAWRRDLFELIRATPHLVWLLLTKRPQNIEKMAEAAGGLPINVALGATCEDQKHWDQNVGHLVAASAALGAMFTFVSIEPMLGPINVHRARIVGKLKNYFPTSYTHFDPLHGRVPPWLRLNWIIVGGESGKSARPTLVEWVRPIEVACRGSNTPFHFKQWGCWVDADQVAARIAAATKKGEAWIQRDGAVWQPKMPLNFSDAAWLADFLGHAWVHQSDGTTLMKMTKHAAGRLLDGVEHLAYPRDLIRPVAA